MMMKKLLFTFLLCLFFFHLTAQEWSINYEGGYPSGRTHFNDGFVDGEGVTFLAGQEGPSLEAHDAVILRIQPDGTTQTFHYARTGCHSKLTCIIETSNDQLFAAGNLFYDTDDSLLVLVLSKDLELLEEHHYGKEAEAISFGECNAITDSHGHVILSTYVSQNNAYQGTDYHGVFFKFNPQGEMIHQRYLIEAYPDPVYFLMNFKLRQMWYKGDTLLCLAPAYGGVMSFVTFDADFNYLDEHPIWQDTDEKLDHSLFQDCYTDYWYNENEALFFSSRGDADHNKLRVSRVNTQGEFLEYLHLNERPDTIDDAARPRCMAAANDSTFYFSFHYHTWSHYPGIACVYRLNDRLEIIGRHLDDDHDHYRTCLILSSPDGGCITVNDSCHFNAISTSGHPIIKKLTSDDFEQVPWSTSPFEYDQPRGKPYPNPCNDMLHIPLSNVELERIRCQISDHLGRIVMDRIVPTDADMLHLDLSRLQKGIYHYRIYSDRHTLQSETFIKM